MVIFKAKEVKATWECHPRIPDATTQCTTNAWTSNLLGAMWLCEVFDPATREGLAGNQWHLLLMVRTPLEPTLCDAPWV